MTAAAARNPHQILQETSRKLLQNLCAGEAGLNIVASWYADVVASRLDKETALEDGDAITSGNAVTSCREIVRLCAAAQSGRQQAAGREADSSPGLTRTLNALMPNNAFLILLSEYFQTITPEKERESYDYRRIVALTETLRAARAKLRLPAVNLTNAHFNDFDARARAPATNYLPANNKKTGLDRMSARKLLLQLMTPDETRVFLEQLEKIKSRKTQLSNSSRGSPITIYGQARARTARKITPY